MCDPLKGWTRKDTALTDPFSIEQSVVDCAGSGLQFGQVVQATLTAQVVGVVDDGLDAQRATVLGNVPALLRSLLEEEAWREFVLPNGEPVTYRRFSQFVAARPPRGLGADMDLVERVVAPDAELRQMVRDADRIGHGPGRGHKTEGESPSVLANDQTGKAVARLARDHPEIYERVKADELSTNAAAVLAGIRPRRISVRLDAPDSIARSLRKHLTPAQVAELRTLLDDP